MSAHFDGSQPQKPKPVMNALEVLNNCVYVLGTRSNADTKHLVELMTSALEVVTAHVREGLE